MVQLRLFLLQLENLLHKFLLKQKKFAKPYGATVCVVHGGSGKWEQQKALMAGCEILVATPGRMIEMIKCKATNLLRCTIVVLDEADRMFEMGFEYQMRSIVNHIRPDRQTLLFSATFKKKIANLAQDILSDPIKITIGKLGQANEDIRQQVVILQNNAEKWNWLFQNLERFLTSGKVLIFVNSKNGANELSENLNKFGAGKFSCGSIHGDRDQNERFEILQNFKKGITSILIATDVAARGLDIKDVNTVINYDVAKNIEIHVHRIGRTGRMGLDGIQPGTAFTLVTKAEKDFAVDLVKNLQLSKQVIPDDLTELAQTSSRWQRVMHSDNSVRHHIPMKGRPGLGSAAFQQHMQHQHQSQKQEQSLQSQPTKRSFENTQSPVLSGFARASTNQNASNYTNQTNFNASSTSASVAQEPSPKKKKSRWDS